MILKKLATTRLLAFLFLTIPSKLENRAVILLGSQIYF